jgi:hypothetical protein
MEWSDRRDQPKAQVLSYRGHALVAAMALAVLLGAILVIAVDMSNGQPPMKASAPIAGAAPSKPTASPVACPPDLARQGASCWRTQ